MSQRQLLILGRVLGWVIFSGVIFQALNPVLKWINRKFVAKRPKEDKVRTRYQSFLRTYLKIHPYTGIATVAIMLVHLFIQSRIYGFFLSGVIAGTSLLVIGGFGLYGFFVKKKKPGTWLKLHRWLTILLLAAVAFHVVTAKLRF